MRKCSIRCLPACDFCKYYHFNGDIKGRYTGNGYCTFHNNRKQDPDDECEDFVCYLIKGE